MNTKISKTAHQPGNLHETARVATIALTLTILMIGIAYLLSAFKQMMFG